MEWYKNRYFEVHVLLAYLPIGQGRTFESQCYVSIISHSTVEVGSHHYGHCRRTSPDT